MEIKRYRVVAVGAKTPDILSKISQTLSTHNYEIETISSLRLGHSIVLVCIVETSQSRESMHNCLNSIVEEYDLNLIIDQCTRGKFKFVRSDAFMRIKGYHETGIKAYVISELINSGLDIHSMESDTYKIDEKNWFSINIKGQAVDGIESLAATADKFNEQGIDMALATDWNLLV